MKTIHILGVKVTVEVEVKAIKKGLFSRKKMEEQELLEPMTTGGSSAATPLDRTLRDYSRVISGVYLATCVYGVLAFVVMGVVMACTSSSVLSWDRRVILGVIFGVFLLGSLILLYLLRKEGKLLVILCPVVTHITGIALGLCTWYL